MPSALSSVAEFQASLLGSQLAPAALQPAPDALDRALFEASDDVLRFCKRKLLTPPATTVGTGGATSGQTSFPVAAAVNILPLDVVVFPSGETIRVTSADVTLPAVKPYPGTVYLDTPLGNNYSVGTAVTVYRQHQYRVSGKTTDPMDQQVGMSQQAQIALAHAPTMGLSTFARRVYLEEYPLLSIHKAFYVLPWTGSPSEIQADLSNIEILEAGWFRLPIGFPSFTPGSIWRVQYTAGYSVAPYDVRDAVHLYMAAKLVRMFNLMGASAWRVGDTQQTNPGSLWITEAN